MSAGRLTPSDATADFARLPISPSTVSSSPLGDRQSEVRDNQDEAQRQRWNRIRPGSLVLEINNRRRPETGWNSACGHGVAPAEISVAHRDTSRDTSRPIEERQAATADARGAAAQHPDAIQHGGGSGPDDDSDNDSIVVYYATSHRLLTSDFDRVCNETVVGTCFPCTRGCRPRPRPEAVPASRRKPMTAAETVSSPAAGDDRRATNGPISPAYFCWQTVRSEAFLFSLQFCSMLLGVWKDTGNFQSESPELHATYSGIEIGAASLLIGVRTVSLRRKLARVDDRFRLLARSTPHFRSEKKYAVLWRWVTVHTTLGTLLFLCNFGCFAMFWCMDRTDWIVLTNNLAMSVSTISTGIWTSRLNASVARLREDQHKVVLHDASLLLDAFVAAGSLRQVSVPSGDASAAGSSRLRGLASNVDRARRLVESVRQDPLFARPGYIVLDEEQRRDDESSHAEKKTSSHRMEQRAVKTTLVQVFPPDVVGAGVANCRFSRGCPASAGSDERPRREYFIA